MRFPGMLDPPRRRFTLADAMLLVAATAPGLIMLRTAAGLGLFTTDPKSRVSFGQGGRNSFGPVGTTWAVAARII